jgi:hypothetical protein
MLTRQKRIPDDVVWFSGGVGSMIGLYVYGTADGKLADTQSIQEHVVPKKKQKICYVCSWTVG